MNALVEINNNEKYVVDSVKNVRSFLNDLYCNCESYSVSLFKKIYGTSVRVAEVTFTYPYSVTLRFSCLTAIEQKQFINFISDHISTNLYQSPPFQLNYFE